MHFFCCLGSGPGDFSEILELEVELELGCVMLCEKFIEID